MLSHADGKNWWLADVDPLARGIEKDRMGWLLEVVVEFAADVFGYRIARGRPGWVEWLASLGCLIALGVPVLMLGLLLR